MGIVSQYIDLARMESVRNGIILLLSDESLPCSTISIDLKCILRHR